MKLFILLIFLLLAAFLVSPTGNPTKTTGNPTKTKIERHTITVLQINAEWNEKNSIALHKLKGCNIATTYLEQQSTKIQGNFSKIPIIVITTIDKPTTPIKMWEGNILFEPTITVEEVQDYINKLK